MGSVTPVQATLISTFSRPNRVSSRTGPIISHYAHSYYTYRKWEVRSKRVLSLLQSILTQKKEGECRRIPRRYQVFPRLNRERRH